MSATPGQQSTLDPAASAALITLEYEQLKDEQVRRIGTRDGLIYAALASIAAVTVAAFKVASPLILLAIPPALTTIGWTYLANDLKVSEIGRYIRTDLAPRLEALVPGAAPAFGWETRHRTGRGRRTRKLVQMMVDLTAFCVPAGVAVSLVIAQPHRPGWALAACAAELLMSATLAFQIIRSTDLHKRNQR